MKWTVGAVREDEVDDYLRWVRGSGNLMPRHAGPIAKKGALAKMMFSEGLWRGLGGLKHPP